MSGFQQGAGNIATAIARGPIYRRQMADETARQQVMGAQADNYRMQALETGAKADELIRNGMLVKVLQRTAPLAQ